MIFFILLKKEIAFFYDFTKNPVRCLLSLQRMGLRAWITGEDIDIDPSMLDPIFSVSVFVFVSLFENIDISENLTSFFKKNMMS